MKAEMDREAGGHGAPPASWRRWRAFLLGALLLFGALLALSQAAERIPLLRPLGKFILESGIDAGALFYTEVEETGDAETHMRNTIRYPPRGR